MALWGCLPRPDVGKARAVLLAVLVTYVVLTVVRDYNSTSTAWSRTRPYTATVPRHPARGPGYDNATAVAARYSRPRSRATFLGSGGSGGEKGGPAEQPRRLRVLFLTHRYEYTSFMDRSFFFQYEAALRHPHVAAELWGGGLPGYNTSLTLRDNLLQRFGSVYFDVIFLFGHANNHELAAISRAGEAVVTIREFECFDQRCLPYLAANGVNVFQMSYLVDMPQYLAASTGRVIIHSPHGADPDVFYADVNAEASAGLERAGGLLAGAVSRAYPLRERWRKLIRSGRLAGAAELAHPGYFAVSFEEAVAAGRPWAAEDDEHVRRRRDQVVGFAAALQETKVLLMDSSSYRYALMKFIEGAMAGCLIISDLPYDQPDLFADLVVAVDAHATDDELVAVYEYWLTHDDERRARVARAQALVLRDYTWDASIDRLIEGVNLFKHQRYGMYFSGGFAVGCAAVNEIAGKPWNAWCPPAS